MRIAYLAHVNGGAESGVLAKVAGQLAQWRTHGHESRLFLLTASPRSSAHDALGALDLARYEGAASRLTALAGLVRAIRAFRPDILYFRWDLYYPPMELLPRRSALVVEINTDDVTEYSLGRPLRARYNRLTRGRILGRAAALVFTAAELQAVPSFASFGGTRVVISNGIDLSAYPPAEPARNPVPRLVYVGTDRQPWQGVDKVLKLATLRPEWQFEMIGSAAPPGAPKNMRWHGVMPRSALIDALGETDIGIGAMALHRKGLNEASVLKVREYLAVGLPTVTANRDADADLVGDWVLRLPNDETNVARNVDAITDFVEAKRGSRVPREAIRHLDVRVKEQERLELFARVLAGPASGGAG